MGSLPRYTGRTTSGRRRSPPGRSATDAAILALTLAAHSAILKAAVQASNRGNRYDWTIPQSEAAHARQLLPGATTRAEARLELHHPVMADVLTFFLGEASLTDMSPKSEQLQIRVTRQEKAALRRFAAAAGQDVSAYVLARALPATRQRFEGLLELLSEGTHERYALAELNDLLSRLAADELRQTVAHAELSGLSELMRNYVAAMVEQASYLKGVRPPGWTTEVAPLEEPHFAAPLKGLRLHLLRSSPVPFKRRNVFIDTGIGGGV